MADYSKDEIKKIEDKWQKIWAEKKVYKVDVDPSKPKYYALDMFPYPSGAGLHVGHPLGYIASDIVSRYKRIKGFNVLHPMGFDSFGLPAEQYAIQTGQHPAITTAKNIETYKRQLKQIAFSFDWDREVQTSDPAYYKWTQWIFGQLFNAWYNKKPDSQRSTVNGQQTTVGGQSTVDRGLSGKTEPISSLIAELEKNGNKNVEGVCDENTPLISAEEWKGYDEKEKENFLQHYRIAYRSETMVNWCAALGTVLSNDEVKDGVSERGGYPVERIKMMQWSMRITAYAERLLKGLDTIDWPEPVKEMQRNWIGKSVGCELDFYLAPNTSLTPNPSPKERGFATSEKEYWHILKQFAKENRSNPTEAESILWEELRNNKTGFKIRRQHAIGLFIADFVCLDRRLVIEVDGEYHAKTKEYDAARTAFLKDEGFNLIRFTNEEVKKNLSAVINEITTTLKNSPSIKESNSLSSGEGRGEAEAIRVFTTRIDTIYGVSFMVIAPEHELVDRITTPEHRETVQKYVEVAKNRSERERMSEVKRISGVFTGAYVINPFNNEKIPVWIADYVLAGYGTGAVMAVPSSDTRDYAFAKHFNLPIIDVLEGPTSDITKDNFEPKSGKMINSDFLNGLPWNEAIEKALKKVEELGIGVLKVNYRMRDAIFGRQRYWGEPFPVYYKDGLPKIVDFNDLPVTLPEIDEYKPTETGEPPLARAKDWKYQLPVTSSPSQVTGNQQPETFPYELTTMPGWAGSSWYWFRYMDPKNEKEFASKENISYWKDVDLYIGGSEHATGHLLYSRFWCKALKDLGYVEAEEPFKKMINQGHIQGPSYQITKLTFDLHGITLTNEEQEKGGKTNFIYTPDEKGNFIVFKLLKDILNLNDNIHPEIFVSAEIADNYFQKENYSKHQVIAYKSYVKYSITSNSNEKTAVLNLNEFYTWYKQFKNSSFEKGNAIFICSKGFYYNEEFHSFYPNVKNDDFNVSVIPVEKLSKSKENAVNPDDIVDSYGADTLRMYEMFLGPLELSKPWATNGIDGVYKFLRRFWNLFHDSNGNFAVTTTEPTRDELKVLHKTIKKIEEDIDRFSFNTSVSEFMICINELVSLKCNKRAILEPLVIALSPFAPHISEELWEKLGYNETILKSSFPKYDNQYLVESSFNYPISINGKVRAQMNFALDMPKEDIEKMVMSSEIVQKWLEGKAPKKVIIVQGKIVNVVI